MRCCGRVGVRRGRAEARGNVVMVLENRVSVEVANNVKDWSGRYEEEGHEKKMKKQEEKKEDAPRKGT